MKLRAVCIGLGAALIIGGAFMLGPPYLLCAIGLTLLIVSASPE